MSNNEVSKTAREKIMKGLAKDSSFGGETNFQFDGLKLTKFTPEDVGKMTSVKAAATEQAKAEDSKKDSKGEDGNGEA